MIGYSQNSSGIRPAIVHEYFSIRQCRPWEPAIFPANSPRSGLLKTWTGLVQSSSSEGLTGSDGLKAVEFDDTQE